MPISAPRLTSIVLARAAVGLTVLATTGCLRINEEHCIANGGDFACSNQQCAMSLEPSPENSEDGCYEKIPEGFVHLKYGLPLHFGEVGDDSLQTVAGVLRRAAMEAGAPKECSDRELAALLTPWKDARSTVNALLGGVNKQDARFDLAPEPGEMVPRDAIMAFAAAIDARVAECMDDPPGTETDTDGETDTTQGTDTTESSTSSEPCMSNEECGGATPFCELGSGECVSCEGTAEPDAACVELSEGMLPVCSVGVCVECTAEASDACRGETPVCDDASKLCVACSEHAECGEAACNFYTGACLPAAAVVHVGMGREFSTLGAAIASFGLGAEGTIIVHGGPNYDEARTVSGGRVLAFFAAPGNEPVWARPAGGAPQLTVNGGSTVLMDGIQVSSNQDDLGLRVNDSQVWIDRSRITGNGGGGVLAENAAELTLRNSFVGGGTEAIGIEVNNASALVLYTTVTASTFGSIPALRCTSPVTVDIRNSIIVSQGGTSPDELSCTGASVTNSATEADVGTLVTTWFVNLNTGNFHLTPSGATAFADLAQWNTGDPPADIDGDPRPEGDGSLDFPGADVP